MSTQLSDRVVKSSMLHFSMETNSALKMIREEFEGNPDSMEYFYALFNRVFCKGEKLNYDKPTVGVTCVQVPEEIVYAAGAVPVRLCSGSHSFEQIGAESTASKSCSLVNATLGSIQAHTETQKSNFDLLVVPPTCDQKKKAIQILSRQGQNVYALDMPSSKESEHGRRYWRQSVVQFAMDIQKTTGKKITKSSLRESIQKLNEARRQYRRFNEFRKSDTPPILGKDAFLVSNAYFFDDLENWTSALKRLNEELEKRAAENFSVTNRKAPRILFTGTPPIFPNLKLPLLIEELGGVIVADEVCSSTRLLHDAVAFDEANYFDMIPAIADRYLKPCTCPIFTSDDDRVRKLIDLAKSSRADGVIYQGFSGCHLYSIEHHGIADAMAKEDIPMLYIETDYGPEDTGQISTRVEAFLESLHTRRRRIK